MNNQNDQAAAFHLNPSHERVREILSARARSLAQRYVDPSTAEEMLHVIEFRLAKERYAIDQKYVREIYPLKELTPLPCTPGFILGVINVRGQILPVIDIKKFFDLPDAGITDLHTVIIAEVEGMEVGILADTVTGMRQIPLSMTEPSLPTLTGIREEYLKGVTNEQVAILDVHRIFTDPKIIVQDVEQA